MGPDLRSPGHKLNELKKSTEHGTFLSSGAKATRLQSCKVWPPCGHLIPTPGTLTPRK